MALRLRSWMVLSVASASLFLAHCGGDDSAQDAGGDATEDASVDAHVGHDATTPADASADTTVDATPDASDATKPDANVGDANDAGADTAVDATPDASDASTNDDDADGDDADGDVADAGFDTGCGPVRTLHPVEAGVGPTCPFALDGGPITCAFGETCCESVSGPSESTCASSCPALDGGTTLECQDPSSCPTGDVCCAMTTGAGQDPGCPTHFLSRFKGTVCRSACQAGEIVVCESQTQCDAVTGTSCQVTAAKGSTFGLCLN